MKDYQKPEVEVIEFTAESITDNPIGTVSGEGTQDIPG